MTRVPVASVWTDPDFAELLADDPELVAIADALQATQPSLPRRRRHRPLLGLAAAAIVAATALVLAAPWSHGGQAAVLERVRSALTPRPGWILHERELVGASVRETWALTAAPYTFREVIRRPGSPPLETGGDLRSRRRFVFSPASNTLYPEEAAFAGVGNPPALMGDLRHAVATGKAALAGRATIGRQTIYRIVPTTPQRDGLWIAYVDGTTFRPVRFEFVGLRGSHAATSVMTVTAYGYLPPTTITLRLASIRATHPTATLEPASALPANLRNRVAQP